MQGYRQENGRFRCQQEGHDAAITFRFHIDDFRH